MSRETYEPIVRSLAQQYGIDPNLAVRLVGQESNWNPQARSPKGAIGLTQLMPETARELGVDPTDPYQNIVGGLRYLRRQFDTFKDPQLALAAYNAGPGAVQKYGGVPPYKETQNYVASVYGGGGGEMTTGSTNPMDYSSQAQLPPSLGTQYAVPPGMADSLGLGDLMQQMQVYQKKEPTFLDNLNDNPFFNLGVAILSNPAGAGNSPLVGIAKGVQQFQQNQRQQRSQQQQDALQQVKLRLAYQQLMQRPEGTALVQNLQAAGLQPGTPEFQQAMQQVLLKPQTQVQIGGTPQGTMPISDPQTGQVTGYRPLPGSPQYQKTQDEAQRLAEGVSATQQLISLVQQYGSEAWPIGSDQAVRGKMSNLYASIVSAIAAKRGLGVLQPGELAMIEKQYPDPSSLSSNLVADKRMVAAYQSLLQDLQTSLAAKTGQMQGGSGVVTAPAQQDSNDDPLGIFQ